LTAGEHDARDAFSNTNAGYPVSWSNHGTCILQLESVDDLNQGRLPPVFFGSFERIRGRS
jgi:hypothetical protein